MFEHVIPVQACYHDILSTFSCHWSHFKCWTNTCSRSIFCVSPAYKTKATLFQSNAYCSSIPPGIRMELFLLLQVGPIQLSWVLLGVSEGWSGTSWLSALYDRSLSGLRQTFKHKSGFTEISFSPASSASKPILAKPTRKKFTKEVNVLSEGIHPWIASRAACNLDFHSQKHWGPGQMNFLHVNHQKFSSFQ